MLSRGSPRLTMLLSKSSQNKTSPKAGPSKKHGGSPREKTRAAWNTMLERSLVELLHEHNTPNYKGQNGWTPEAWNKIVKEFLEKEKYVSFTKAQIQDKEKELKRDYKVLKDARAQSGVSWDEKRSMIIADPPVWTNIIISHPRAKKFRNKPFPLFDALGELHDGNIAEGTYNFTSTNQDIPDLTLVGTTNDLDNAEARNQDLEDTFVGNELDDTYGRVHANEEEDASVGTRDKMPQRKVAATSRNGEEKEPKRQKKNSTIEEVMERYLNIRTKLAENEAARSEKKREACQSNDFSIKKCISVLNAMEVTKEEKAKAYRVFKDPDNRQIFLSACDDDPEAALIWLKDEMA